jgi:uncharacterized protein
MRVTPDSGYIFSPSDLMNFLGCRHYVYLDLTETFQQKEASEWAELLQQKGLEHEARFLAQFRDNGKTISEIPRDPGGRKPSERDVEERLAMTKEALWSGADVIYQAVLQFGSWWGYSDFLIRVDTPSDLGNFSYEVLDTKLSRRAEPKYVVQLGVYSDILKEAQGRAPVSSHLLLGDGRQESSRADQYSAYIQHAQRRLEAFVANPPAESYPLPCEHCKSCRWQSHCTARWEADDHLSLIANIRMPQVSTLESHGIRSIAALAAAPAETKVPGLAPEVFGRLRAQAILQNHKRTTGRDRYELIEAEPGKGFARLPRPDAGDLFFDMEGDPLDPEGLEYLFGLQYLRDGQPVFKPFWAHDHQQECQAFQALMDFFASHSQAYPDSYIYHYNHYEPTALKRLASKYAVAEHQLDDLLRRERFVDLYKVVREAIRVSEPAYSLKNLETFYMGKRDGQIATASESVVVYNRWRITRDDQLLKEIADYNRIDCESTRGLREWLITLRPAELPWFAGKTEPVAAEGDAPASPGRQERERRYAEVRERLEAAGGGSRVAALRMAELLGFHDREAKPEWWAMYDRRDRSLEELVDDAECLAGLTQIQPPESHKQSHIFTCSFPLQETKLTVGSLVQDVATLSHAGEIVALDEHLGVVKIKRGNKRGPLPARLTVGPSSPLATKAQQEALYRVADDLLQGGRSFPAIVSLLLRAYPRFQGGIRRNPIVADGSALDAVTDAVSRLERSYLFIQGPPGSGKTYTTAHVMVELMRQGKKVAVAANSHRAIHNVLDRVEEMAREREFTFVGVKKSSGGDESRYEGRCIQSVASNADVPLDAQLVAGTSWLFADARFDRHFDYLFIDEAGQVALANAVAMGTSARSIVLVGDQMQLSQPVKGVHPGASGLSVLDFLLEGQPTVAPDRGVFLNVTRRLHPSVCDFISSTFYEGRLTPFPENARRRLVIDGPIPGIEPEGVHFVPVEHSGCSQKSEEEGKVVKKLYAQLLRQRFQDKDGSVRPMTPDDVLVVAPYNVQFNHLKSILPSAARVGTVDKFQGQEARVVLVSMATSDAENLPRDAEFLFSANRLNVALSRAECLAVVVASPKLLEAPCRTVEQLRLINNFCRLVREPRARPGRSARPSRAPTSRGQHRALPPTGSEKVT